MYYKGCVLVAKQFCYFYANVRYGCRNVILTWKKEKKLFSFHPTIIVAPGDYTAITSQPVTFISSPSQMCIPFSISNDNVVEATESFAVTLDSTDRAVGLIPPFSPNVTIIDSTGKHLQSVCYCCYEAKSHCLT